MFAEIRFNYKSRTIENRRCLCTERKKEKKWLTISSDARRKQRQIGRVSVLCVCVGNCSSVYAIVFLIWTVFFSSSSIQSISVSLTTKILCFSPFVSIEFIAGFIFIAAAVLRSKVYYCFTLDCVVEWLSLFRFVATPPPPSPPSPPWRYFSIAVDSFSLRSWTGIESLFSIFLHSLWMPTRRHTFNSIESLLAMWSCKVRGTCKYCALCDACTCAARSFRWERNCEIGSFPLFVWCFFFEFDDDMRLLWRRWRCVEKRRMEEIVKSS